jgi:hypothetical protein
MLGTRTAGTYLIGAGRTFGFDAAFTFGNWVATPSLWDAFGRNTGFGNVSIAYAASSNHVLISVLSHVIYSLTGSHDEAVYRVLPAVAGGLTVGVMATLLARRFGWLAGLGAGLFIATDPIFVEQSRELRGYSLMALFAVLSTLMLDRHPTRRGRFLYGVFLAAAIAAQSFAILLVVGHVLLMSVRNRPALRSFAPAGLLGGLGGLAINARVVVIELSSHALARAFHPGFPWELVWYMLGTYSVISVGLWLSVAALGIWTLRQEKWLWWLAAGLAGVVLLLWLVVQPPFLYPRFFIYLVPASAYVMAAAIRRWWVLGPIVVLGAALAATSQARYYTTDQLPMHQVAQVIARVHTGGGRACVLRGDDKVVVAYSTAFVTVSSSSELPACEAVVIVTGDTDPSLRERALKEFPVHRQLPALYPTLVLTRDSKPYH